MLRVVILGVPRSGKSRLARRLARECGIDHHPIDALISALGDTFPQTGVGRQFADVESTAAATPLILSWCRHLDYEGNGYVLEGYHLAPETAAELVQSGLRVAALGYRDADVAAKCHEIRKFARPQDWTEALGDAELATFVERFRTESAALEATCAAFGLRYFDVSHDAEEALRRAFEHLSGAAAQGIREDPSWPR